jgi:hypothetical protein
MAPFHFFANSKKNWIMIKPCMINDVGREIIELFILKFFNMMEIIAFYF